jgi:thiol-disulfide isomerase/thioredoxin
MRYIILLFALSFGLQAEKINFQDLSFDEAMAASAQENKPIFMDCFTTWCGPCKWMTANIFTDAAVAQYFNENYICLKVDMEKGEGLELARTYGIRAYPTLLFLDSEGGLLLAQVGADRDPQTYIKNGEKAKDPKRNLPYLLANVTENMNDADFMSEYFMVTEGAGVLDMQLVDEYFSQFELTELGEDKNWEILTSVVTNADNTTFQNMLEESGYFIDTKGPEAEEYIEQTIFYTLANKLYRARDESALKSYILLNEKLMSYDFTGKDKIAFRLALIDAEKNDDWDAYSEASQKGVKMFYWDDARELNSISWTIYEKVKDPATLKAATMWAKRAVELTPEHHVYDTYAHLLYVTEQTKMAIEMESKAIELAKEAKVSFESYEEFVTLMEDAK